jgi:zinc/manganese transport system substrate-binding protein
MKRILTALTMLLAASTAAAEIDVVATVPNMGMLARTVGGDEVRVRVLASPDRDPHYLEARPSMMAALRRADLLVAVGAELEVGWLPAALRGSHNPRVQTGQPGYFEGAAHVRLIQTDVAPDRALGDVHPAGNPHYYMDPPRMAQVAAALAERMARLRPERREYFEANARSFAEAVEARLPQWQARAAGSPGVVFYHKDVDYLAELLEVPILGYVEPLPGIPPTARHLRELVTRLRGRDGVVLHVQFQPGDGPAFLARELGWQAQQIPNQVAPDAASAAYFGMIDRWVAAMAGGGG